MFGRVSMPVQSPIDSGRLQSRSELKRSLVCVGGTPAFVGQVKSATPARPVLVFHSVQFRKALRADQCVKRGGHERC
jgi:hypothetical protein